MSCNSSVHDVMLPSAASRAESANSTGGLGVWHQLETVIDDLRGGVANKRPYSPRPEAAIGALLKLQSEIGAPHDPEWSCDCGNCARRQRDKLREALALAYGYLWHVNNEPGTPKQYPPQRAAYEARKVLRELLTHEQRGRAINEVASIIHEAARNDELTPNVRNDGVPEALLSIEVLGAERPGRE